MIITFTKTIMIMNKQEFLNQTGITEAQFKGEDEIKGSLDLFNLTSIPEGFNPTVGWSLDLSNLTSIPEGFNPTVGWSLNLSSLTSIPEGFNPTVGGGLDLSNLTSIPEGFNPTVGWSLDLSNLTSIPEGFNPTVGWSLNLSSLTSIPEGFNPTVGGGLDLSNLTSIPEGFNPTVGGYLDLRNGLTANYTKLPTSDGLTWGNGKYILADNILSEVISHKGNVYKIKGIGKDKESYLVTDGSKWSHGETLKQAKDDLIYKISNRDKSEYEGLETSHTFSLSEAIESYRVITGACSQGVKDFIQSKDLRNKKEFTIQEISTLTQGAYGNQSFNQFFSI